MRSLLIGIGLIILIGCESKDIAPGTSDCIEQLIIDLHDHSNLVNTAKVYSYQYKGETVYYFQPTCCDIMSQLYDANCTFICSPDGGFSGIGDGQCMDFIVEATDAHLIWEKD